MDEAAFLVLRERASTPRTENAAVPHGTVGLKGVLDPEKPGSGS